MTTATNGDDERRRVILDAAERLLRHYGPQKTTIAEIAREAEVGVGTVYLEFPSKEAIIEELSRLRHAGVLHAMRQAAIRGGETFAERFRAVMNARLAAFYVMSGDGAHARDLLHCVHSAVKAAHARHLEDERAFLAELLRAADRAREIEARKAESLSGVILRAYASFTPPWLFAQPEAEVTRASEAMHDLVLNGLLKRRR